jgi:4-amino-4-deoxy-L-arabinose transferase-like glycosyltransferase
MGMAHLNVSAASRAAHQPWALRLVLLMAGGLYLVGNNAVGLWDRDEPRYAQTSRQMLESGDWVVPRFLGQVRTAKPIMIYWLQATCMGFLGPTEFAARLPSALCMLATLSLLGLTIGRAVGWQRALWTIFILATSALAIAAAKMCITDAALLLFVTGAQLCLFGIYAGARTPGVALLMWACIGLAGLTKGPVVIGVQLSTVIVLAVLDVGWKWKHPAAWKAALAYLRWTRPVIGVLVVVAIAAPWLVLLHRREPRFLPETLYHDVFTRMRKPLEGHEGPPGFYLATVLATYFPWCLFLVLTFVIAFKHRRLPHIRFALAACIGPWIVWEFIQTKLMHYVLPAFPALAFLTADALVRCFRGQHRDLHRPLAWKVTAVWALAAAACGLIPWLALTFASANELPVVAMTVASIFAAAYAATVLLLMYKRKPRQAAVVMGVGMAVAISIFYALILPRIEFLWMPQRLGRALQHEASHEGPGAMRMLDYQEDSLGYYSGGMVRPARRSMSWSQWLDDRRNWAKWLVMTRKLWEALPQLHAHYIVVTRERGVPYADRLEEVEVVIVRRAVP